MSKPQQYDLFLPQALPSASLGRKRLVAASSTRADLGATGDESSAAELDRVYAAWNTRIDKEIKAVAGGLRELVELADITTTPAPNTPTLAPLHLKLKTSTLIRATQTLRDTAHELALALALGDDVGTAARRDAEAARLKAETEGLRRAVAREFGMLVARKPVGEGEEVVEEVGIGKEEEQGGVAAAAAVAAQVAAVDAGGAGAGAGAGASAAAAAAVGAADKMDVDDDEEEDEFEEV